MAVARMTAKSAPSFSSMSTKSGMGRFCTTTTEVNDSRNAHPLACALGGHRNPGITLTYCEVAPPVGLSLFFRRACSAAAKPPAMGAGGAGGGGTGGGGAGACSPTLGQFTVHGGTERWKVTAARAVSRRAAWGEPNWVGAWPWPRSVWRVCATVSIRNLAVSASLRSLFFTPEERGQWMKVRRAQARGQPRKVVMVVQGTNRQPGRASSTQAECFAL